MYDKKIIFILNILCPILSLYNISITTKRMKTNSYHKIYYTRYIGRPIEVYMNELILLENNNFKYKNNYLYIRSNQSVNHITLVWDDSIGEGDIMYDSTNMILNDESNNINAKSNEIFMDKFMIEKPLNYKIPNKDGISDLLYWAINGGKDPEL